MCTGVLIIRIIISTIIIIVIIISISIITYKVNDQKHDWYYIIGYIIISKYVRWCTYYVPGTIIILYLYAI